MRLFLKCTGFLAEFNSIFQVIPFITLYVFWKMSISSLTVMLWQLLNMHTQLHLFRKISKV